MTKEQVFALEPESFAQTLNWDQWDYKQAIQKKKYYFFTLPKEDGSPRKIEAPANKLKFLQHSLADLLQWHYLEKAPVCVHGYIPAIHPGVGTRNILTNARAHLDADYVLNLDIDEFFHSIRDLMILDCLRSWFPGIHPQTAEMLVLLATLEGRLPMGSPCSPVLSNMCSYPLDLALLEFCTEQGLSYSRYVDDMSFSSSQPIPPSQQESLVQIIKEYGFCINAEKRKYYTKDEPKVITGLVLHKGDIAVQRKFLKEFRQSIKEYQQLRWLRNQLEFDKKWLGKKVNHMEQSIRGQLAFLQQILGKDDPQYKKLSARFEKAKRYRPSSFNFYF